MTSCAIYSPRWLAECSISRLIVEFTAILGYVASCTHAGP